VTVTPARVLAVAGMIFATALVSLALFGGGGDYTVRARFENASQLVKGGQVQVAGRPVGTISEIRLTDDSLAEVVMSVTDPDAQPLPVGTRAQIRTGGLAGVANRFVDLQPGPAGADDIPDGGVIPPRRTKSMVDLDALFNDLDPPTRRNLQALLRFGDRAFSGTSRQANQGLRYLNPALSQTSQLTEEVVRDEAALRRVISTTATVSGALADHSGSLEQGITNTATTLRAISSERAALGRSLSRAPGVLRTSGKQLGKLSRGLDVVPATLPLARLLARSGPPLEKGAPLVDDLRPVLPELRRALDAFPPLARQTVPVMRDTTRTAKGVLPILSAARPYTPDLVSGFAGAFFGTIGGYYDANGHYVRIAPSFATDSLPGFPALRYRTGLTARCPGAAVESAADRSNPFTDDPALCDRAQDHQP
jgi:phospholipid/cholesterol/gamma-HCH transport system substrate-binding protein